MSYVPSGKRYDSMIYRRCGRSGLMLPAISLGLWHNFGGVDCLENQREMVRRAFDLGITHFDLANNYGPPPGSAEENFGRILSTDLAARRDELIISSKAGWQMWPGPYGDWGSRKYIIASCDQSLKRMGLEYVDIFYHHRPDPNTPLEESMGALAQLVRQGKALYAGISSYSAEQTRRAAKVLKDMGVPCLIHQPSYSLLNRWVEDGLLEALGELGIGGIAFCPLAQGVLTGKYLKGIPAGSRAARGGFLTPKSIDKEMLAKVGNLSKLAKARGQSLAQMSLAWILRNPAMTSALIGASSASQIEENVGALGNLDFSKEELARIDKALGL